MAYNVLSVDMDYILSPCINLYNDMVKLMNRDKMWDNINEVREVDKHLSYDEEKLKYIFKTIMNAVVKNKDAKVVLADNHDAILFELSKEKYIEGKVNVYNIDHHHDINYNGGQIRDVDVYDSPSICNWIWYLDKYEIVNEYHWIRNNNSDTYKGPKLKGNYSEYNKMLNVNEIAYDVIFICNSPQWLPKKYDHFFEMLKTSIELITNKTIEIESRNYVTMSKGKTLATIKEN